MILQLHLLLSCVQNSVDSDCYECFTNLLVLLKNVHPTPLFKPLRNDYQLELMWQPLPSSLKIAFISIINVRIALLNSAKQLKWATPVFFWFFFSLFGSSIQEGNFKQYTTKQRNGKLIKGSTETRSHNLQIMRLMIGPDVQVHVCFNNRSKQFCNFCSVSIKGKLQINTCSTIKVSSCWKIN